MKKILSIFLVVFILCQCFASIGAFAFEGDIVEATTKLLVKSNMDRLFLPANDPNRLNTSNGIPFEFHGDSGVSTVTSATNTHFYGGANSKNVEYGTYNGDSNNPDMRYFVASNAVNKQWGIYNKRSGSGALLYGGFSDKTTFDITFLDECTEEHKRTNGTGTIFNIYYEWTNDDFYYAGANANSTSNYMYPETSTSSAFGEANRWIDLRVEMVVNGTDNKKSAYWKYHEEDDTEWRVIEEDEAMPNKTVYALMLSKMSSDASDTARILINDFKVTRTYRPTIESVTVDGETIESGATDIPYDAKEITVTFDQTMAEGLEDKIKLTAQDAGDADITVTTTDDRTYTIAVEEDLIAEKQYSLDLSECVSLHKLFTEEEFTFETGASPVISVSATGLSLVNWKTSNTINVEFTAPVVASTVNTETVKLCYADGTPSDAPVIVDAAPYGANITVGQLDAWKDYKIVFTDAIVPKDDGNIFNECEILFSTEHADVLEFDPNKADSKNKLVATVAANYTSGIFAATTTDEDTGFTYVSKVNDNTAGASAKDASISFQVNNDLYGSDLSFEYIVRMSGEAPTTAQIASINWGGKTQGANITTTNIAFAGGESFAHNNEFHNLKFNMAVNSDATKRTTTGYLMTENGWEQKGTAQYDNKSVLEIAKYQAMAGQKIGPIDFARVIISTNPKADVMKSIVDYDKSEITLSLGKNMTDGNEDEIAVTYTDGTTEKTAQTTAEKIGTNTYTIKFNEVIRPNTEYTIDLSALTSADGVIGAQNYTFTTPAARVETPVFTLTGNTASVQVKNNTGSALTYTVIVAVYDTNNVLKAVGHDTYTLLGEGPSETHTVSANLDKYASENKAGWTSKLMLWNGDITAATPIRAAVDGTIQ